jgi:bifunctional oligoribonuclease and PAP phosphatase NrnA
VSLPAEQVDAAVDALRAASDVALACHVGPDGDALGSMLALGLGLRRLGKTVVASWGSEPFRVPALYSFLPGQDLLVPPETFPGEPSLLVTFDTGSVDRLGDLAPAAAGAGCVVVVDHHVTNTRYGTVNLVDPDAAASVVLVEELLRRLDVELDADLAACLYVGLTTDTGSFKFAATTPEVHELAARLLATGVKHDEIARAVWDTNRFGYLKLLGTVLDRAELVDDVVWSWISQPDLESCDLALEDVEGAIDVLRTAAEAEIALILKQQLDGRWAASMRSKGGVDVGAIAVRFGGGGHRFAAGFTSEGDLDATVTRLRSAFAAAPRLT